MKATQAKFLCLYFLLAFSCCKPEKFSVKKHQINLGHFLFFEKKLSVNRSKSCASCHSPQFAFTDGYRRSVSALGENLLHNAPSLINLTGSSYFDWDNPGVQSLETQIKRPLYNKHPLEMGCNFSDAGLQKLFQGDSLYYALFRLAYPDSDTTFTAGHIEDCIIAYLKTLNFSNSRYDQYLAGEQSALTEDELNGLQLFSSDRLKCSRCHRPPAFTLSHFTNNPDSVYVNIGLYNLAALNTYPPADPGIRKKTLRSADDGKFKIPSLRNVMLTAPYMHDGSVETIEEVINIYARGGRKLDYGEYHGDGFTHKNKHPFVQGFTLSSKEKNELICFLASLTDTSYLANPQFTEPFSK